MATPLEHVRPGDLISALAWNTLVDKINTIEVRLDELGSGEPGLEVIITGLVPASSVRIGQDLEILGRNFGFVRGAQRVLFDSAEVVEYKTGSSDTHLIVKVPQVPNIPEEGRDVVMTVSNGNNAVTRTVNVLPVARPLEGNIIDVFWDTVNPNPITVGQPVTFGYRLHSRAGVTASFAINPIISITGLQSSLKVLDADKVEIPSKQITLAPSEERVFFVQTAAIPSGTSLFSLSVNATAGAAVGTHYREYPVGQLIILPDSSFTLSVADFTALNSLGQPDSSSGSYNANSRTIRLKPGAIGRMRLLAVFKNQGVYTLDVHKVGTANGWEVSLFDTPSPITLDEGDFPPGTTESSRNPQFGVTVQAGGSAKGQVEFTIRRNETSRGQSRIFQLELMT